MTWRKVKGWYEAVDANGDVWRIEPYGSRFRIAGGRPQLGLFGRIDTLTELKRTVQIRLDMEAAKAAKATNP